MTAKLQALIPVMVSGYTGQRDAYEQLQRERIVEFDGNEVRIVLDPHTQQCVVFSMLDLQDAYDKLK